MKFGTFNQTDIKGQIKLALSTISGDLSNNLKIICFKNIFRSICLF